MTFALAMKMFGATIMAFFTMIGGIIMPSTQQKEICMIAHRGFSGIYHENTVLAFEKAAEHGSGGAETDIRKTSDGVYVCSHNSDVELKDGTVLEVKDNTYAALTAQPLKRKNIGETYLCTFKEYLEVMAKNNMVCFIELKDEFTDEEIKEIFDLCAEVYDLQKCILQSFNMDNLLKARKIVPDLPIMLTWGDGDSYEGCIENGISIDADYRYITEDMIKEFHNAGLEVGVWTVNNIFALEYCKSLGVDYIESDLF